MPNLRRRIALLAVLSILTVAMAAALVVQSRPAGGVATAPAAERSLAAPLFTPRRSPQALAGLLSRSRLESDFSTAAIGGEGLAVCVQARTLGRGDVLFSSNADRPEIPASTLKLLTGGAALEILGPDFHFTTRAAATVAPRGGVVEGNLYLVGGGDPLLSTAPYGAWEESRRAEYLPIPPRTDLAVLARSVRAAGITRVTGGVVGDASFFDDEWVNPGWKQSYFDDRIIAPITALSVNRNLLGWETGDISGFPADPPAAAAATFKALLAEQGVTVDGGAGSGRTPGDSVPVAELAGAPLVDVIQYFEQASDNYVAEHLLKAVGRQAKGSGGFAAGAQATSELLAARGVTTTGLVMLDGSGLARGDQVPCSLLADLLARSPSSPGLNEMVHRLAVSGVSGTLRQRFPDPELKGKVQGKTGSLSGVSNLAGIVAGADGRSRVAFAVLVNGDDGDIAIGIQRTVLDELLRYPSVAVEPAGGDQ